jgi:hypothetical protein
MEATIGTSAIFKFISIGSGMISFSADLDCSE